MPRAMINGRAVEIPRSTTDVAVREIARIDPERNLIRRTREGNFLVPRGTPIDVDEGDTFIDAPARVKGRSVSAGA
jgi:hypothetical protein